MSESGFVVSALNTHQSLNRAVTRRLSWRGSMSTQTKLILLYFSLMFFTAYAIAEIVTRIGGRI